MGSVRMYRPAPRMATAEAKIYFRDVVDARGAKTEIFQFTPQYPAYPIIHPNSSFYSHHLPNFTESHTSFTVSVADLPRGPVFVRHSLHFTPFSNFLKKKVNFFQKSVDMGLPLCYTLDD